MVELVYVVLVNILDLEQNYKRTTSTPFLNICIVSFSTENLIEDLVCARQVL